MNTRGVGLAWRRLFGASPFWVTDSRFNFVSGAAALRLFPFDTEADQPDIVPFPLLARYVTAFLTAYSSVLRSRYSFVLCLIPSRAHRALGTGLTWPQSGPHSLGINLQIRFQGTLAQPI